MCIFITTPVSVKVNKLASDPEQLSHPGEKVAGRQGEVWNTWALVESLLLRLLPHGGFNKKHYNVAAR